MTQRDTSHASDNIPKSVIRVFFFLFFSRRAGRGGLSSATVNLFFFLFLLVHLQFFRFFSLAEVCRPSPLTCHVAGSLDIFLGEAVNEIAISFLLRRNTAHHCTGLPLLTRSDWIWLAAFCSDNARKHLVNWRDRAVATEKLGNKEEALRAGNNLGPNFGPAREVYRAKLPPGGYFSQRDL